MKLELRILPWTLLSLYSIKILIMGAQMVDAPILLILAAFLAVFEYKEKDAKYKELKNEMQEVRDQNKGLKKEIEEVRVHVSSLKLTSQIKNNNLFGRQ